MNADRINELYAGQIFSPDTQKLARERIHWMCSQAGGVKILDIGCSQGIVCLLLGREGFQCIGIDYEKKAIEFALAEHEKEEEIVRQRISFELMDATSLPFEDGCFDTIILGEILEHLTHPEKVLKEARRVLKDGGIAVITVPFGLNPSPDHKKTYYPLALLETILPFFKTKNFKLLDNHYILVCGEKTNESAISSIEDEPILKETLWLQKAVEERCILKEQDLLEKSVEFANLVHKLNTEIDAHQKSRVEFKELLDNKQKEFKISLADKDTELSEINAAKERELAVVELEFKKQLAGKENELTELVSGRNALENDYKTILSNKEKEIHDLLNTKNAEIKSKEEEYQKRLSDKEQEILDFIKENSGLREMLDANHEAFSLRLDENNKEFEILRINKVKELETLELEFKRQLTDRKNEITKLVADKNALEDEYKTILSDKEKEIQDLLNTKNAEIKSKEDEYLKIIADREQELAEQIAGKNALENGYKAMLAGKEQEKNDLLVSNNNEIQSIEEKYQGMLTDKELEFKRLLTDRENEITKLVADKNALEDDYKTILSNKEKEIQDLLNTKNAEIKSKEDEYLKIIADREQELAEQIAGKNALEDGYKAMLAGKEQEKNDLLVSKNNEIQSIEEKYQGMLTGKESEFRQLYDDMTSALKAKEEDLQTLSEILNATSHDLNLKEQAFDTALAQKEKELNAVLSDMASQLADKDLSIREIVASKEKDLEDLLEILASELGMKENEFNKILAEKELYFTSLLANKKRESEARERHFQRIQAENEREKKEYIARKIRELDTMERDFKNALTELQQENEAQVALKIKELAEKENEYQLMMTESSELISKLTANHSELLEEKEREHQQALTEKTDELNILKANLAKELAEKTYELNILKANNAKELEANEKAHNQMLASMKSEWQMLTANHSELLEKKEREHQQVLTEKTKETNRLLANHSKELEIIEWKSRKTLAEKTDELNILKTNHAKELEANEKAYNILKANHAKELEANEKAHNQMLASMKSEWQMRLVNKDQEMKKNLAGKRLEMDCALISQEEMLKHAYTWRVGWVFTGAAVLAKDFMKHPFSFWLGVGDHFKNYYRPIFPRTVSIRNEEESQRNNVPNEEESQRNSVPEKLLAAPLLPAESAPLQPAESAPPLPADTAPLLSKEKPPSDAVNSDKIPLGCILDEFTTDCFRPESHLITFRPDNWREVVEQDIPRAIFVESAWRGNDGSWLYKVAKFGKNYGDELQHLLSWAKENRIPSIFWNKEDPVHFERFVDKAALFDHVFTSDADCIPEYRKRLGHDRVYALPFAAQPAIHNPILSAPRDMGVCFAGTYYGDRHEERRNDMEYLLRPALSFGLEIYDRQYGLTGKQAEAYKFPYIYQPCIRGRLEYDEMVKAYKKYKVFLNVNSVKNSPTMFSRRVFELLACGTPVISTYSRGIVDLLGEDLVFISESEAETQKHLQTLLNDDNAWHRASVRGIRKVMEEHTYAGRLRFMLDKVGIDIPERVLPSIGVVARLESKEEIDSLVASLRRQTFRPLCVFALSKEPFETPEIKRLRNTLGEIRLIAVPLMTDSAFRCIIEQSECRYLAFMDVRDVYGANYLKDYALAAMYSGGGEFFGKHSFMVCTGNNHEIKLHRGGQEFRQVSSVSSASLVVRKDALSEEIFRQTLSSRTFKMHEAKILSLDRFNYLQTASGANQNLELLPGFEV